MSRGLGTLQRTILSLLHDQLAQGSTQRHWMPAGTLARMTRAQPEAVRRAIYTLHDRQLLRCGTFYISKMRGHLHLAAWLPGCDIMVRSCRDGAGIGEVYECTVHDVHECTALRCTVHGVIDESVAPVRDLRPEQHLDVSVAPYADRGSEQRLDRGVEGAS